jgi:hypothetical protein
MPKDDNQQNQNPKVQQNNDAPVFMEETLPPMLGQTPPPALDLTNPSPASTGDTGSSAPTNDLPNDENIPVTVTGSAPKKKFAGGKVIATILGLFLLVGATGAGVYLVQQNQNVNEKAQVSSYCNDYPWMCEPGLHEGTEAPPIPNGATVTYNPSTNRYSVTLNGTQLSEYRIVGSGGGGVDCRNETINCPPGTTVNYNKPKDRFCLTENGAILCNNRVVGSAQRQSGCCGNIKIDENGEEFCRNPEFTTYECDPNPTKPSIIAYCQNIKAYDEKWILLTNSRLSQLKVGDEVNFCVTGVASSGSFDKAEFIINKIETKTTTKRPNNNDYCQKYVIPAGVTRFNITARIHHVTLGWK